jgi:hypothetical protein
MAIAAPESSMLGAIAQFKQFIRKALFTTSEFTAKKAPYYIFIVTSNKFFIDGRRNRCWFG